MQATHVLTPDTQAILLLCGTFGTPRDGATRPLALAEYNRLAQWLQQRGLRPSDLLRADTAAELVADDLPLDAQRLLGLLERGGRLALAVESWANKGLWVVSRSDEGYPQRLKSRLGRQAPPILYGVGEIALLGGGGLAIVGSREVDDAGSSFARRVAETCARQGVQVVSGGARGVDMEAMLAALEHGGAVAGVLADSLARAAVSGRYRDPLLQGRLVLVSPYDPASGFHVGNAMGRNKHIHALADWSVVVSASEGTGGTWAGATEALKQQRALFVRVGVGVPAGNQALLAGGAMAFPDEPWADLADALRNAVAPAPSQGLVQRQLVHEQPASYAPAPTGATAPIPGTGNGSPEAESSVRAEPLRHLDTQAAGAANGRPPDSVFAAILPLLRACLDQPRDPQTLATLLDVRPAQVKDWLERAVAEGIVVKSGKPLRYALNQREATLFPLDGFDEGSSHPRPS